MGRRGGLAFSASPGPLAEPPGQSLRIPGTCTNSSLLSPRLGVSVQEPSEIWAQFSEYSKLSGEGVDEVAKEFWNPKAATTSVTNKHIFFAHQLAIANR